MSAIESIATPVRPTSPVGDADRPSRSRAAWGGRTRPTAPSAPAPSRYRKRAFDSSAEPNPAYWRIVHGRPRYMSDTGRA